MMGERARTWLEQASDLAAARTGLEGWHGGIFTKCEPNGLLVEGWVCPLITKGKRKGKPNYRKKDLKTNRVVFVSMDELP